MSKRLSNFILLTAAIGLLSCATDSSTVNSNASSIASQSRIGGLKGHSTFGQSSFDNNRFGNSYSYSKNGYGGLRGSSRFGGYSGFGGSSYYGGNSYYGGGYNSYGRYRRLGGYNSYGGSRGYRSSRFGY